MSTEQPMDYREQALQSLRLLSASPSTPSASPSIIVVDGTTTNSIDIKKPPSPSPPPPPPPPSSSTITASAVKLTNPLDPPTTTTATIESLSTLPVLRPVDRRLGRVLNITRHINYEAYLGTQVGQISEQPCTRCCDESGPFVLCVTVPGHLLGSCTNCHYSSLGTRCSFRGNTFAAIPAKPAKSATKRPREDIPSPYDKPNWLPSKSPRSASKRPYQNGVSAEEPTWTPPQARSRPSVIETSTRQSTPSSAISPSSTRMSLKGLATRDPLPPPTTTTTREASVKTSLRRPGEKLDRLMEGAREMSRTERAARRLELELELMALRFVDDE